MENLLFQAPWREYQARVLKELEDHLHDDHLHIVAAPGSGKTILGLEVMRRLGKPTIILAPTLTIRNQWVDRLTSMFLPPGSSQPDWISKDLRNPKRLVVITYQALHAAFSGEIYLEENEGLEPEEEEDLPSSKKLNGVGIIQLLKEQKIRTMILDEAHHLRKEWWKALTRLKSQLDQPTVVSLTATPPYDVEFEEWQKYEELCGPMDAEIPVPELVKRGDLCPHQDYVYFSVPTQKEEEKLKEFKGNISKFLQTLQTNTAFLDLIGSHPWLNRTQENVEAILNDPKFFSALLIFLNSIERKISPESLKILGVGARELPLLNAEWLEALLSGILYEQEYYFAQHNVILDPLRQELKRMGAIERRKITIDNTKEIKKLLGSSLAKLDSIVEIARSESQNLGEKLRMVILADFIRKAELPSSREGKRSVKKIGVVPIFEYLRLAQLPGITMGILTGSLIFIPQGAKTPLEQAAQGMEMDPSHIRFCELVHDPTYLSVEITGEHRHKIVRLITQVFNGGHITLLVGTQALLGEGWDAPSINTLVLASYVGSYMLSNQMRGRAIRINPEVPNKVANIWHLVTLDIETVQDKIRDWIAGTEKPSQAPDPFDEIKEDLGNDLRMLRRRFRAFEGLSYRPPYVIENGFKRLALSEVNWNQAGVTSLNQNMLSRAQARGELPQLWQQALQGSSPKPEMREKLETNFVPRRFVFGNTLKHMVINALILGAFWGSQTLAEGGEGKGISTALLIAFIVALIFSVPKLLKALYLFIRHGSVEGSLKQVARAVLDTLQNMDYIKSNPRNLRVETAQDKMGLVYCRLDGATSPERRHFLEALQEVLGPTYNPRYLFTRPSSFLGLSGMDYHPVPRVMGQNKKNALFFQKCWTRYVGKVDLVYTRTLEGRLTLLKARTRSLASAFQKKTERISVWE